MITYDVSVKLEDYLHFSGGYSLTWKGKEGICDDEVFKFNILAKNKLNATVKSIEILFGTCYEELNIKKSSIKN